MSSKPADSLPLNIQPSISYNRFIDRILTILQKTDKKFADKISTFRRFDLPEQTQGNDFPVVYVTTASTPEVSRQTKYTTSDPTRRPTEHVTLEFWAVILVSESVPASTQSRLYTLSEHAHRILAGNHQLRDPSDRSDPLCISSTVYTQGRIESHRGQILEGMTLRIRPVLHTSSQPPDE